MANQIADIFEYLGEQEGTARIVNHLRRFWSPAMRDELARIAASGEAALSPLALAAAKEVVPPGALAPH
jgi:hypothetical protein